MRPSTASAPVSPKNTGMSSPRNVVTLRTDQLTMLNRVARKAGFDQYIRPSWLDENVITDGNHSLRTAVVHHRGGGQEPEIRALVLVAIKGCPDHVPCILDIGLQDFLDLVSPETKLEMSEQCVTNGSRKENR